MSITNMHYWPVGGPAMACNANAGFRTSDRSKVNCTACRATFTVDPIADRRQRALEAYNDAIVEMYNDIDLGTNSRFELAIEVATQVKITDDMLAEFAKAWHEAPQDGPPGTRRRAGIKAAFRAAGFEVVE